MRNLISGFLDLLFPPRRVCPLCGAPEADSEICPACLQKMSGYQGEPVCFKCGRFFKQASPPARAWAAGGVPVCRDCSREGRAFYMARAAGPYEGDLKGAVQRLKYTGKRGLASHLSRLMFQAVSNNPYYIMAQLVAPVPLSRERIRHRGFNQSELLAHCLSERIKIPLLPVVRKIRDTPPQASLGRAGRSENLAGAFEVTDPGAVRGKNILLVDDVITTGNTLNIVAQTLALGGAATVICVAAAAGRTSPGPWCARGSKNATWRFT